MHFSDELCWLNLSSLPSLLSFQAKANRRTELVQVEGVPEVVIKKVLLFVAHAGTCTLLLTSTLFPPSSVYMTV